jgi:hypothetical protein
LPPRKKATTVILITVILAKENFVDLMEYTNKQNSARI